MTRWLWQEPIEAARDSPLCADVSELTHSLETPVVDAVPVIEIIFS